MGSPCKPSLPSLSGPHSTEIFWEDEAISQSQIEWLDMAYDVALQNILGSGDGSSDPSSAVDISGDYPSPSCVVPTVRYQELDPICLQSHNIGGHISHYSILLHSQLPKTCHCQQVFQQVTPVLSAKERIQHLKNTLSNPTC